MANKPLQPIEQDRRYLWHPFTPMAQWVSQEQLVIEAGEGEYLIDNHGRRYLDGVSSLWCNVHGHQVKEIDQAIKAQLGKIAHSTLLGLASPPSAQLAQRLTRMAPAGLEKVFFSDNGSTAVEAAAKIAFQYWRNLGKQRDSFLVLRNGYHGDTLGSVSLGGIDLFHETYKPLLFKTHLAPSPYCYRCELGLERKNCGLACAEKVEEILSEKADEIAAMVVEPIVQGAGGIIVAPEGYLRRIREITKKYGVWLIADEVAVGFGRTGKMFACEHEDVRPDIMCLAKGITGGYLPLAATLVSEEIFEAFNQPGCTFYHGHTYTGNALACAAALANLDVFAKDKVLERLPAKIEQFGKRLKQLKRHDFVGDVRHKGLMGAVELVADPATKRAFDYEQRIGAQICQTIRGHDVILRPLGDVIVLMPPLSISVANIDFLFDALEATLQDCQGLLKAKARQENQNEN